MPAGDATPINLWDLGAADGSGLLAPTNSIVQQNAGTTRTRRARPTAARSVVTTRTTRSSTSPRGGRTRTSWARSWSRRTFRRRSSATTTSSGHHLAGLQHRRGDQGGRRLPAPSTARRRASPRPPLTSTTRRGPARAASTSARTRSRRPSADLVITKTNGVTTRRRRWNRPRTRSSSPTSARCARDRRTGDRHLPGRRSPSPPGRARPRPGRAARRAARQRPDRHGHPAQRRQRDLHRRSADRRRDGGGRCANTATVAAPAGIADPSAANNSATDTDLVARDTRPPWPCSTTSTARTQHPRRQLEPGRRQPPGQRQPGLRATPPARRSGPRRPAADRRFGANQGAAFTFANTHPQGIVRTPCSSRRSGGTATRPPATSACGTDRERSWSSRPRPTAAARSRNPGDARGDASPPATRLARPPRRRHGRRLKTADVTTLPRHVTIPTPAPAPGHRSRRGGSAIQLPTSARVDNFSGGTLP